jgi:hypothetical protein
MSENDQQCVFILIIKDSPCINASVRIIAVYDNEKMAEEECNKRNDYEAIHYGIRSDWIYEVQKHHLNSVIWKL